MRWLTEEIATAAFTDVPQHSLDVNTVVVDVRDLVDKAGNTPQYIQVKIEEVLLLLKGNKKVIICCDYGMSRSNSIAVGVITKWENISFSEAVTLVKEKIDGSGVKVEMLNTVYQALRSGVAKVAHPGRKNVLLTGGTGFVGKRLSASLASSFSVSAPGSTEINLMDDILDLDLYVKSKDIDTIVHLANPRIFTTNKSVGDSLTMLKNVLDVCRTNGIKMVYLSGWEIYSGYKSNGLFADEKLGAMPKGTYGETKWFCELLIQQYHRMYSLPYQIIRSGPVYGPGGEKPKFIYNFIEKARSGSTLFTHRYLNGSPVLDLLFIDDLVSIVSRIAESDFEGEINIGSGTGISTFEIANLICELTGSASTIQQVPVEDYAPNIIMDACVAKALFQWSPGVTIKAGIERILKSL